MGLSSARELAIVIGIAIVIVLLLILLREAIVGSATRSRGLGVSREDVQRFFEQPLFGFTVASEDTVKGQPVVSLKAPTEGVGELNLFGPKRELTRALITVGLSRRHNSITAKSAIYLNGFIMIVARDWQEGSAWVQDNLRRALATRGVVTTLRHPDRIVSLEVQSDVGSVLLSIEADFSKTRPSVVVGLEAAARSSRKKSWLFSRRSARPAPRAS